MNIHKNYKGQILIALAICIALILLCVLAVSGICKLGLISSC